MAIPIQNHKLTKEQYIKLFSNTVSGIACQIEPNLVEFDNEHSFGVKKEEQNFNFLQNIRYSKSMMLDALKFWIEQYCSYYIKLRQIDKSFINMSYKVSELIEELKTREDLVKSCPNSFLFSHRHVQDWSDNNTLYKESMDIQLKLLNQKYPDLFKKCKFYGMQKQTMDPYYNIKTNIGIEFTVFPCEHPYIPRQKISKVGITEKGNVYVLHQKGKKK